MTESDSVAVSVEALRTANVPTLYPYAVSESAWVLAQLGKERAALDRIREGEKLLQRQVRDGVRQPVQLGLPRIEACLSAARPTRRGAALAKRAIELASRQPGFAAHAMHLLGDIATHSDQFDAEQSETHHRKALAHAEPRGMRPLIAHCYLGLGKLYERTGKGEQAREHLTTATTMYREMDMRFWLDQAGSETSS